jgi:hypothetical protein
MVSLTGLSSAIAPSFSFATAAYSRGIGFKNQIVGDEHPDREAGADGDRRLNVQRALHDLPAGLADAVGGSLPQGLDELVLVVARACFRPDAENRRQDRGLEQHTPVVVDLVLQTGIAFRVGAGLTLQHDPAPVRHDLKAKVDAPNVIGGGVAPKGVADASLYRRLSAHGLTRLKCFPQLVSVVPGSERIERYQQQILAALTPAEAAIWHLAVAAAERDGTFFIAQSYHCAVATKPG